MQNLESILSDLLPLIRRTGFFILEESYKFSQEKVERKGARDLVSYVDRTAEEMLFEGCTKILPGSGFIREEGGEQKGSNAFRWIIDPLDGTTNFTHGIPAYCVSVALQENEETVLACVFDMNRDEMFSAIKGKGARLNNEPISVSRTPILSDSVLGTGFPYTDPGTSSAYMAVFQAFLQSSQAMRRFGAAALDLAWVACGRFDGFYEIKLNAWDVAAGALLISEAGGTVSDFKDGKDFLFGKQIAGTNAQIHGEVLRTIGKHY